MNQVLYFNRLSRTIQLLTDTAKTPQFQEKVGPLGQELTLDWLDTLARQGGAAGQRAMVWLDTMRRNMGASVMAFKLSSFLIQPTSLFDASALIGGDWVARGVTAVGTSKDVRQFLLQYFPELRRRIGDDPAYLELSRNSWLASGQRAGFAPLRLSDGLSAASATWGAYLKALAQRGLPVSLDAPVPDAVREAELLLRRTQNSSYFKDLPPALARGRLTGNLSVDKALLQFQSFMLNRWSVLRHDFWRLGIREHDPFKAVGIATWLGLATVAETGIRLGSKMLIALAAGGVVAAGKVLDEELGDDGDAFTRKLALTVLGNVPFLGSMVSMAVYEGSPVPALQPLSTTAQGAYRLVTGKKPETKIRAGVRALEGVGGLAGLPGAAQAGQLARQALTRWGPGKPVTREQKLRQRTSPEAMRQRIQERRDKAQTKQRSFHVVN